MTGKASIFSAAVVFVSVMLVLQIPQASAIVNSLPVLSPIADQTVTELETVSFTAHASDTNVGQTLTFGLSNAPSGASINPNSGQFTWTTTTSDGPGAYSFDVTVSDGVFAVGQSVMVIVNDIGLGHRPGHSQLAAGGGQEVPVGGTVSDQEYVGEQRGRLYADPEIVPLGGLVNLTQEYSLTPVIGEGQYYRIIIALTLMNVTEPDGDICEANGLPATIYDGTAGGLASITKEYPTEFSFVVSTGPGNGVCETALPGEYLAYSLVTVTVVDVNGQTIHQEQQSFVENFKTSFFVLPESPLGAIVLISSSLATLGGFLYFGQKRKALP